ncbi:hypothetical protein NEMIN01_2392 [Nematocida minor]|uniref:uncharacterized protein n=1 Tax=Nematocida minor TaxID=1912983 RepID=UPI0022212992|nr:uncharacterized protein NEMIN01_2392 [Nematocida minor]KAI5193063.1 hypothetical protein NEMIN01_2392 [Nematocida minor]
MHILVQSSSGEIFEECLLVPVPGTEDNPVQNLYKDKNIAEKNEEMCVEETEDSPCENKHNANTGDCVEKRPSILEIRKNEYADIRCTFIDAGSIEILGLRHSGKSLFMAELLAINSHLSPTLIITKGPVPSINHTRIYTATSIDKMNARLESIITDSSGVRGRVLGIDALNTILFSNDKPEKEKQLFFLLKILNCLGTRVLVVNSLLEIVKKTSNFYSRSILFKPLPH